MIIGYRNHPPIDIDATRIIYNLTVCNLQIFLDLDPCARRVLISTFAYNFATFCQVTDLYSLGPSANNQ